MCERVCARARMFACVRVCVSYDFISSPNSDPNQPTDPTNQSSMSLAVRSSGGLNAGATLSAILMALSSAVRVLAWIAFLSPFNAAWVEV